MTDGEPETVVLASLQKIKKSIKNPIKPFLFLFYLIKSETSDSFVNHFDGHFAYLKTLDFYFKGTNLLKICFVQQNRRNQNLNSVLEFKDLFFVFI